MKTTALKKTKTSVNLSPCLLRILCVAAITAVFILRSTNVFAGQVTLGWDKNLESDVAGYKVYYGTASRNYTQSIKITSPNITTCTVLNLTDGRTYYFAATAYNAEQIESDYSNEVFTMVSPVTTSISTTISSTTTSLIPTTTTTVQPTTSSTTTSLIPTTTTTAAQNIIPPGNLLATAAAYNQINISWQDNSSIETGFKIERAPDVSGSPGSFVQITTVGANVTVYQNTGLTDCTVYWYRVRAYNDSIDSGYSNTVSATTESRTPSTPTQLSATETTYNQINLSWRDNSGIEAGYKIERAPDVNNSPGSFVQITTVGANVTTYQNTGLAAGTRYWYRVRVYNACTDSGYSNTVSATTGISKSLVLTAPNGGQSLKRNSFQKITWIASESLENLNITLWQNNILIGTIAENINPAVESYEWKTGEYFGGIAPLGTGYTIKIEEQGTGISDQSDEPFAIVKISVKTPSSGDSLRIGTTQEITWVNKSISNNLRIVLFKDGVKVGDIENNLSPSESSYTWTVGSYMGGTAEAGTGYQVQVREIGTDAGDRSDGDFTLIGP